MQPLFREISSISPLPRGHWQAVASLRHVLDAHATAGRSECCQLQLRESFRHKVHLTTAHASVLCGDAMICEIHPISFRAPETYLPPAFAALKTIEFTIITAYDLSYHPHLAIALRSERMRWDAGRIIKRVCACRERF